MAAPLSVPNPPDHALGRLRLSEVIATLSYALDLTEGQPRGHCLRCAWIGTQIGRRIGLGPQALSDLYYALLLKDSGCSSNASRLFELYGGDELVVKQRFKRVDTESYGQLARFVLRHAGPGEALTARAKRFLDIARHGGVYAGELIRTRCERGADIVRRLGFPPAVAAGVHSLDEHWNGKGRPEGLIGDAIPLAARIALLAQVADVFHAVGGPTAACREARRRAGTWFDRRLVAVLLDLASEDWFWAGLDEDGLDVRIAGLEPLARVITIDEDQLDAITEAFADVIDAKSSFTSGHSRRVASYAEAIAAMLQFPRSRRRWLRRAGLLHDIGKLGVSNAVLDKPGRLDEGEWAAMRRHAALTEEILSRLSVFRDMAAIAAAHHERLDGNGYPKRLAGAAIALETRILTTADIFDALSAERPYRAAMPVAEALAIMDRERGTAIDGTCLDALKACLADTLQPGTEARLLAV